MRISRALLSVWDKSGIVDFARGLAGLGVEIVSTGGTAAALRAAGIPAVDLSDVTNFPEILGGRVKTLHPAVHGALLAVRGKPEHAADLARHGIRPIDVVAVTLYPFETVAAGGADLAAALEHIDIGGVALLRAAAKNFDDVVVLSHPAQYPQILDEFRQTGAVGRETRLRLAGAAFARTSAYDAAIAAYLRAGDGSFPQHLLLAFEKIQDLRYGENPHQRGAFYREPGTTAPSAATARQRSGKALSYNNIYDLDAALGLVQEFTEPAAVIVKHGIPCGASLGPTLREAYLRARDGDPVSAFGGVVAVNRPADRATAEALAETFLEAVIAPGFTDDALACLVRKRNLRLMEAPPGAGFVTGGTPATGPFPSPGSSVPSGTAARAAAGPPVASPSAGVHLAASGAAPVSSLPSIEPSWGTLGSLDLRRVHGGLLVQDADRLDLVEDRLQTVTSRTPTAQEWADLRFAWTVCRYVRSNAVVFARDRQVVGVGAGQMNRVEPVRLAARQAGERARGAVMASEAFFPFPDAVEEAVRAGVTAIIHPGGSIRDAEVTAAAEAAGIAMVTTGIRHFRH